MTPLDKTLKRELNIDGQPYVLTLTPENFTITSKGKRKGLTVGWKDLITGDAALATALQASVGVFQRSEGGDQGTP